jgi:hypothetical protein
MPVTGKGQRRKAQLQAIKDASADVQKTVRVVPSDDKMRRLLKHPNGMAFRPTGGVEWPMDRFTKRRLKDGTVKLEEEKKAPPPQEEKAQAAPQSSRPRSK